MPRPTKKRIITVQPGAYYFKPRAIPMKNLEEVVLQIDEVEAIRLADLLANTHEQAASKMQISRPTFGRIVERARMKIADAIINGKAIKVAETMPENLVGKVSEKCLHCGAAFCLKEEESHTCILDERK